MTTPLSPTEALVLMDKLARLPSVVRNLDGDEFNRFDIARLRATLVALGEDRERLDWAESQGHALSWNSSRGQLLVESGYGRSGTGKTWREAIDNIRKSEAS